MAKKQSKRSGSQHPSRQQQTAAPSETKSGNSLKDMLTAAALEKLKQVDKELKTAKEREEQEAAERRRREQEEKEKNKSFAELLDDYDKKGGGKFS